MGEPRLISGLRCVCLLVCVWQPKSSPCCFDKRHPTRRVLSLRDHPELPPLTLCLWVCSVLCSQGFRPLCPKGLSQQHPNSPQAPSSPRPASREHRDLHSGSDLLCALRAVCIHPRCVSVISSQSSKPLNRLSPPLPGVSSARVLRGLQPIHGRRTPTWCSSSPSRPGRGLWDSATRFNWG